MARGWEGFLLRFLHQSKAIIVSLLHLQNDSETKTKIREAKQLKKIANKKAI